MLDAAIINNAIAGFVSGIAPLAVKAVYDSAKGQSSWHLRGQIKDLTDKVNILMAKNSDLETSNRSKDKTIDVLSANVEREIAEKRELEEKHATEKRQLETKLAAAEKERRQAVREAKAGDADCKKRIADLTERTNSLETQLQATTTGAQFANLRAQALETGQDIADIALQRPTH